MEKTEATRATLRWLTKCRFALTKTKLRMWGEEKQVVMDLWTVDITDSKVWGRD